MKGGEDVVPTDMERLIQTDWVKIEYVPGYTEAIMDHTSSVAKLGRRKKLPIEERRPMTQKGNIPIK